MAEPSDDLRKNTTRSRNDLNLRAQMLTGHARLGKHLAQWHPEISKICRWCRDTALEEPVHLLTKCPALTLKRHEWKMDCEKQGNKLKPHDAVLNFFRKINIQDWLYLERDNDGDDDRED